MSYNLALRSTYLLVFFILSLQLIYAQRVVNFDSLQRIERTYLKQDLSRIEVLNKLAYGYSFINPSQGIKHAHEAKQISKSINSKAFEAEANFMAGCNYLMLFEKQLSVAAFEECLSISLKIGDKYREGLGNLGKAEALRIIYGKNQEAEILYNEALRLFNLSDNQDGIAKCYRGLALLAINNRKDSLALVLNQKSYDINQKKLVIPAMAFNYNTFGLAYDLGANYTKALENYKMASDIFEKIGYSYARAEVYANTGLVYFRFNDYPTALDYYQRALAIDEKLGNRNGIAKDHFLLSSLYGYLKKFDLLYESLTKAIKIFEEIGNEKALATCYGNMGVYYSLIKKDYKVSLGYFEKAVAILKQQNNQAELANLLGQMADTYDAMGDKNMAFLKYNEAIEIAKAARNYDVLIKLYNNKAITLKNVDRISESMAYSFLAVSMLDTLNFPGSLRYAYINLSKCYEQKAKYDSALYFYRKSVEVQNKIFNSEKTEAITRKQAQFEFDKKEANFIYEQSLKDEKIRQQVLLAKQQEQELRLKQQQIALANQQKETERLSRLKALGDLQKEQLIKEQQSKQLTILEKDKEIQVGIIESQTKQQKLQQLELDSKALQRNLFIGGFLLVLLLSFFVYRNYSIQVASNKIISLEKHKSDKLLLNILPEEVAAELKASGSSKARYYDQVTVMFTDFVNFTGISESLTPEELVYEIDFCFKAFDEIIERNGLEKIKTIGDAYLAVCGLPKPNANHAAQTLKAAKEILEFVSSSNGKFGIRIGVHTGSVVAGIVGSKKYAYDIWGDTVNTAARMEQNSEDGKVNVSSSTYQLTASDFNFIYRGKIKAKNKGEIDMYFLA
jgi:class 3 adenylate cyclase